MTTIPDAELGAFADRVKGKVIVITGAANGIGKETALLFAKHGSKIVVADIDEKAAQSTAAEITAVGGEAIACKCDVLSWDEQVAMFEAALSAFGSVDIAFANAGILEQGVFTQVKVVDGKPVKPNLATLEVDLVGAIYTIHLSLHYLMQGHTPGSLKSLIAMSSMAAWQHNPLLPVYCAAKLGVLGLVRSIEAPCTKMGIRLGIVHPFFAATNLLTPDAMALLSGMPFVPLSRIAGAVLHAAADPDPTTSASAYALLDGGDVLRLEPERIKGGVYDEFEARLKMIM